MAYRRCISVRAALFARTSTPSFGYFSRENDRDKPKEFRSNIQEYLTQSRSLGSTVKSGSWRYGGSIFREGSGLDGIGLWMNRYMSTSIGDVATCEAVASQVPAMSEVAIAAADSAFPVAALQYLIGGVHSFAGLNWWSSIALTTLLFNGATIPFLIQYFKIFTKFQLLVPPADKFDLKLEELDPSSPVVMVSKFSVDFFKHVCHGPLSGILFLASTIGLHGSFITVSYFAITNMAEKVPSFESGGALWFTDLTTDAMCIFPFLTALAFWGGPKCIVMHDGDYTALYMRRPFIPVLFITAALSFMGFPQAMYCHWITSILFIRYFAYLISLPGVKKALGFPKELKPGQARKP